MKEDGILYVKGSGSALANATEDTFVALNLDKLLAICDAVYPDEDAAREARFLQDVTLAKLPGQEQKRPSVETLLHALFPQRFVLHLHPALVNGLTCARNGATIAKELFGEKVLWVPVIKPGYVLAKYMHACFTAAPHAIDTVLLENHGVFFAADTSEELDKMLRGMMEALQARVDDIPNVESEAEDPGFGEKIKRVSGMSYLCFNASPTALAFADSLESAKPIMKPFNPDQIVYCGANVQFAACVHCLDEITANVIIMKGVGVYTVGETEKKAENAMTLVKDAMKVATYARAFGGEKPLNQDMIDFIVNWEFESYRKSVK